MPAASVSTAKPTATNSSSTGARSASGAPPASTGGEPPAVGVVACCGAGRIQTAATTRR